MTTTWETVCGEWLQYDMSDGAHESERYALVDLDPPNPAMTDDERHACHSEMRNRFKGTWWVVGYPEYATTRYIDDASIHGPFATEQEADAHRCELGERRR